MTQLSLICISYIIKQLLCNVHIPFKYKLSLLLISKSIFKLIRNHREFKKLKCGVVLTEEVLKPLLNHLQSESSIIKNVKTLKFQFSNSRYTDGGDVSGVDKVFEILKSLGEDVDTISMSYVGSNSIPFPLFTNQFGNLKVLDIYLYKTETNTNWDKIIDGEQVVFPALESIKLISTGSDQIPFIVKLLNRVQNSIRHLNISHNHSKQYDLMLNEFLVNYNAEHLQSIEWINPLISFKTFLENHKKSLKSVLITLNLSKDASELRSFELLESCTLYSNETDLFNCFYEINKKPNVKKLVLATSYDICSVLLKEPLPPLKYIEELEFRHCSPLLLNQMLNENKSSKNLKHLMIRQDCPISDLIDFLETNRSIQELNFILDTNKTTIDDNLKLSLSISRLPYMHTLRVMMEIYTITDSQRSFFDYLQLSQSLDYIIIKTYLHSLNLPNPFEMVPNDGGPLIFIRNGIHYNATNRFNISIPEANLIQKLSSLVKSYIKIAPDICK
ncbi:hypothetical protein DLAC_00863 [Tieghemostelium lacteum]|uniref:Uncharacterized protein n=1 Tax=Tieghemostelium lacteum TaxID=361077 RepID=A0A152A798_TIELA|nr:hypothetical protein DLAC_00863 [Tieghemostelium lacteum]|eukprot:KYR02064.1 hypothetical protein DLAC_00863 [Tieghemostelium lacteum]